MKKIILALLLVTSFPVYAHATEDPLAKVFEKIDETLDRVESGVSLNSYAESLAELKIEYRKARDHEKVTGNLLFTDRMKKVLNIMDEYSTVWKAQETDRFQYMRYPPQSARNMQNCLAAVNRTQTAYDIPCIKAGIMETLREVLVSTRSAHYNGW